MKGGLSSPMNDQPATPNVHTTGEAGQANMCTGPKGHVDGITPDIVSSPQQGPRRVANGEREAELNKKQGW
jgi:hypothetical protein